VNTDQVFEKSWYSIINPSRWKYKDIQFLTSHLKQDSSAGPVFPVLKYFRKMYSLVCNAYNMIWYNHDRYTNFS